MKDLSARFVGLALAIVAGYGGSGCSTNPPVSSGDGSGGAVVPPSSTGGMTASGGVSPSTTGGAMGLGGNVGSGSGGAPSSGGTSGPGSAVSSGGAPGGGGGGGGTGGTSSGGAPSLGGSTSAGGAVAGTSGNAGTPQVSPDLIAATHADGYLQLFPASPIVAIGPWFTYNWGTSNCNISPASGAQVKKGTGGICFSGKSCTGAAPGAGLGVKLCTTPGDLTGWTEMQTFMIGHGMSGTNAPYGFGQCNTGNKITSINWEGSVPSGTVVDLHDAADLSLITLTVAGAATSVAVPASVDGGKIASVHFSMNGTTVPSWSFCVSKVTLSYQ